MNTSIPHLRVLREADEPLGLFFRMGRDDHKVVGQLLSENVVGLSGGVFDPSHCTFQETLRAEVTNRNLDAVLDPRSLELATLGGHTKLRAALPWAKAQPHVISDFAVPGYIDEYTQNIADFVSEHGFTGVLAPTHYLAGGSADPWLAIDRCLVASLRQRLDRNGCQKTVIHYPLATSTKLLTNTPQREAIKDSLQRGQIDRLWLRIHPFGSDCGDTLLSRYIAACQDLHSLHIPIIAEKTGSLGLALLAFGAVSGLESGIASGEKFDFNRLKNIAPPPKPGQKFGRAARVYIASLGIFLKRDQARQFFESRNYRHLGCTNSMCCPKGFESMISDHRRHFAYTRMHEVAALGKYPPHLRAEGYLQSVLRPATDNIGRVVTSDRLPEALRAKLEGPRRKLAAWQQTLGELSKQQTPSFSMPLERMIARQPATA